MPFSDVKLIVWDLDDTLWQGTLHAQRRHLRKPSSQCLCVRHKRKPGPKRFSERPWQRAWCRRVGVPGAFAAGHAYLCPGLAPAERIGLVTYNSPGTGKMQ